MPIKAKNKHRYPPNWKNIRAAVLHRAQNCCELCAAPNNTIIRRCEDMPAAWVADKFLDGIPADRLLDGTPYSDPIKVVLTIAHLDPTYQDNDPKFLLALCQRCHLKIDRWTSSVFRRGLEVEVKEAADA